MRNFLAHEGTLIGSGKGREFNSLQAQSEACEAYIRSQRHEGWARRLSASARSNHWRPAQIRRNLPLIEEVGD